MQVHRGTSAVWEVAYHIVWCPKYRKSLPGSVLRTLRTSLCSIAEAREWSIKSMEVMPDHIHLFIEAPPSESPTGIVKVLKGTTAKVLFERHSALRTMFQHGHIWSPSYYIGTVGYVSEDTVRRYVQEQRQRTVGRPRKDRISSPQQVEGSPCEESS
ncbi:MAG: IS200/IS605 family transposase [Promethearchaeati archaeon SRVP18_Atabeyarchaeia-1]